MAGEQKVSAYVVDAVNGETPRARHAVDTYAPDGAGSISSTQDERRYKDVTFVDQPRLDEGAKDRRPAFNKQRQDATITERIQKGVQVEAASRSPRQQ